MATTELFAGWHTSGERLVKDLWPLFERTGIDFYPVVFENGERQVRVRWTGTARPVLAIFTDIPTRESIWLKLTVGPDDEWYRPLGLLERSKRDSEVKKQQRGKLEIVPGRVPTELG